MLGLEKIQKLKIQFDGNDALVFAVAAVLLVLPYSESLKNIFLGLTLLVFVYCYFKKSGVRFGFFAMFCLLWIVSLVVGNLLSDNPNILSVNDELKIILFAIVVSSIPWTKNYLRVCIVACAVGVLFAIVTGAYDYFILQKTPYWQLKSVGHVNQSSIYVLEALCVIFPYAMLKGSDLKPAQKILTWTALIAVFVYLVFGESRATFAGMVLVTATILAFDRDVIRKNYKRTFVILCAIAVSLLVSYWLFGSIRFVEKQIEVSQTNNLFTGRLEIWKSALRYVASHNLFFGIGQNHFMDVPIVGTYFEHISHGHNSIVHRMTEGGLWGVVWYVAFLCLVLFYLIKHIVATNGLIRISPIYIVWQMAVLMMIILIFVGCFNTTMRYEHGLLAAFVLGVFCSFERRLKRSLEI